MSPAVRIAPSLEQRLERLASAARHDLSCACGTEPSRTRGGDGRWIYPAALPSGQRVPMLKILQQSGCERSCAYCAERLGGIRGGGPAGPDAGRGRAAGGVAFTPDELARVFVELHRAGRVFGLFLSSAIRDGAVRTMDRMLATAELLRRRHRYRGYLHLKLVPGARPDQVERAMQVATRVSVNLEVPTAAHLARIAPAKQFEGQLLAILRQVAGAIAARRFRRAGQTTQFVVGAAGETDQEIARAAAWLYGDLGLARVYYSGLQPLAGTPLEGQPPTPFLREHRLYQVDFLLRKYGFAIGEIPFEEGGRLSLETDPKTAWARRNPGRFPIDVNSAPPAELVRVPGIGPTAAERLVELRAAAPLRSVAALRAAGARWRAASPWILLDGRRPEPGGPQLALPLGGR